jgi:drug/metabolite transporter (DMT)-like permease
LWSLVGLSVKLVRFPDDLTFTFYRSLAALGAMALIAPFFGGVAPPWRWMVVSAAIYPAVVILLIKATAVSTAATGILLQYTAPAWVAILAWLFQKRRIDRATTIALSCALGGIVCLFMGQGAAGGLLGPLCGAGSGLAFGALILILEHMDRISGGKTNPALIVLFNNVGCVVFLFPIVAVRHVLHISPGQLAIVAACGIFTLALPYVLFQFALRHVQAVDAALLSLLEPVLNPLWVALIAHEIPGPLIIAGGGCIVVALVLEAAKKK